MGPSRTGVSAELAPPPPSGVIAPTWSREVGAGFAGPVVQGDLLVLFHRQDNQEIVEAIRKTTGETHWRSSYASTYRDDFGFDEGPRSPATIAGDRVYTLGAQGRLSALDLTNGRLLWQVDTAKEYGVPKAFFGAAGSPLIVDGKLIANLGGTDGAGIVALDAATGTLVWKATTDAASYSSGVLIQSPATPDDAATPASAAFFTREGLALVDAATGHINRTFAWRSRLRSSVNAALPLVLGSRVLLTSSYGTGAVLLDVKADPPTTVWTKKDSLAAHYAPVVALDETLYGIHGRVEYGGELRSVNAQTGAINWSQDTGAGSLIAVGGQLLVLLDSGELLWVAADPSSFRQLGKLELFKSTTRALPAYSDGLFFARDEGTLAAWRLGQAPTPPTN